MGILLLVTQNSSDLKTNQHASIEKKEKIHMTQPWELRPLSENLLSSLVPVPWASLGTTVVQDSTQSPWHPSSATGRFAV